MHGPSVAPAPALMASARTRLARPARIRVQREYTREPAPVWQEELDRLAPPAESVSSLRILWEPGDPWAPVERWVIWQVYPIHTGRDNPDAGRPVVPHLLEEAVRGPHPRSTGHACFPGWCPCGIVGAAWAQRWVDGPAVSYGLSARQWELFQATGRFHKRWWVVQGPHGGHRVRYNAFESQVSQIHGGPEQPPALGELPYAEPDARTWASIGAADLLRRWAEAGDFVHRDGEDLDREDERQAHRVQRAMWQWLDQQIAGPADRLRHAIRKDPTIPRPRAGEVVRELDEDEELARYLTEHDMQPLTRLPQS